MEDCGQRMVCQVDSAGNHTCLCAPGYEIRTDQFCGKWWWLFFFFFCLLARIWGECLTIHSSPSLFFLKWRLARAHLFYSLCQDQSTVAERAKTTVAECFLTSCVCARFRIGSNTMPGQRYGQPTPASFGQGCVYGVEAVCIFRCNLPPALLAK